MEEAPTRASSWLKAYTSPFSFLKCLSALIIIIIIQPGGREALEGNLYELSFEALSLMLPSPTSTPPHVCNQVCECRTLSSGRSLREQFLDPFGFSNSTDFPGSRFWFWFWFFSKEYWSWLKYIACLPPVTITTKCKIVSIRGNFQRKSVEYTTFS